MLLTLSHYSLFRVQGEKAKTFLQGQLTADLEKVNNTNLTLTGYCDSKGRLWSIMRVFQHQGIYYFHLPSAVMNATIDDLNKYAVFSKVSIEPVNDYSSLALIGEKTLEIPENVLKLRVDKDRVLLIGPIDSLKQFKPDSDSPDTWNLSEIRAGIPTVWASTLGKLLPHDVNLIELDAVSFTKGCYKGQEIIARMQYRAQRKKQMYHAVCETSVCPTPGSAITDQSGKNIGDVVSAAVGEIGCEMLVILPIAVVDEKGSFLCAGNDCKIV